MLTVFRNHLRLRNDCEYSKLLGDPDNNGKNELAVAMLFLFD